MGNPWDYDFSAIGARKAPLLVVVGSDGDPREKSQGGFSLAGNSDIHKLIPEDLRFEELNLSKSFTSKGARIETSQYDCVLNLITDPDQHTKTLARLAKLLRGYKGRIINRPEAVLRSSRDLVARRLAGVEGLRAPKVLRLHKPKGNAASLAAARANIRFPVIVRRAGTHTGDIIGLAADAEELDAACQDGSDFLATEFVDFRSRDGLYRKHRVFFFGDRWVFRHMIAADGWNIHARQRSDFMAHRQDLLDEEAAMFRDGAFTPGVRRVLDLVGHRMGLDIFGMDFGIGADGQAVLFEANATMNFFPFLTDPRFDYVRACIEPSRRALVRLLGGQA